MSESEAREGKLSTYARGEVPVIACVPEALPAQAKSGVVWILASSPHIHWFCYFCYFDLAPSISYAA